MVKIIDLVNDFKAANGDKPFIAFEYFPPRTEQGVANLYERFERMKQQNPLYMDVTWGAGGSTSDLTIELCKNITQKYGQVANMHLTCTNMPKEKVDQALESSKEFGIQNIVALRGDPPAGQEGWEAVDGGFACALDLVKYITEKHGDHFCISVAGYPEGHPNRIKEVVGRELTEDEKTRSVTIEDKVYVCSEQDYKEELDYLKQKVDAGASFIITQMFFDTNVYKKFCADCKAHGINVPVIPGIMLLNAYGGFKRMTGFCKTRVPKEISDKLESMKDDEEAVKAYGIELGTQTCKDLLAAGAPGLHFYTLNLEKTTYAIMDAMGLKIAETEAGSKENENTTAGTRIAA